MFTELLLAHTDTRDGFMKYAIEWASGAVIHIASFIKTGSVIPKLIGWDSQTAR
jgi:hypothetical protein